MNQEPAMEMPKYISHKVVHALKIKSVEVLNDYEVEIVFENSTFSPFHTTMHYYMKHQPEPGGYYVVYADGYESFSPADAFEDGYSPV